MSEDRLSSSDDWGIDAVKVYFGIQVTGNKYLHGEPTSLPCRSFHTNELETASEAQSEHNDTVCDSERWRCF